MQPTRTAVVTGYHSFDVLAFHQMVRGLEGVDAYVQHVDDFASSSQEARDSYEVVLFYFMPRETPVDANSPWYAGKPRAAVERLGETGQGVVVLHHAILAYPEWPTWSAVCGIADRSFQYFPEQRVPVKVEQTGHSITEGTADWEITDETYLMESPGKGSEVLLTTDHPKSMRTLAWTRAYRQARVFCCALGHDNRAYANPHFGRLLGRGIGWCAGR